MPENIRGLWKVPFWKHETVNPTPHHLVPHASPPSVSDSITLFVIDTRSAALPALWKVKGSPKEGGDVVQVHQLCKKPNPEFSERVHKWNEEQKAGREEGASSGPAAHVDQDEGIAVLGRGLHLLF